MREIIYTYARNIAFFIIFMNVILMLVPNNKYRGYIKTVLGLVLIIIMLKPMEWIFEIKEKQSLDKIIDEYSISITKREFEEVNEKQKELIKKQFEKSLLNQIKLVLKKSYNDIEVKEIEIEYVEGENITGISKINIYASGGGKEKMKKIISDFYNLSEENINVIES